MLVNTPGFEPDYEVIFDCARRHNWRLSIEERLDPPKGWRGDGALVLSVDYPVVQRYIRRLRRLGIPVVDIELSRSTRICNRCLFDIRGASELVSEHFKALGFRHAAFFAMESLYLREAQNRIFADVWNDRCESWIRKGRAVRDWDSVDDWARRLLSAAQADRGGDAELVQRGQVAGHLPRARALRPGRSVHHQPVVPGEVQRGPSDPNLRGSVQRDEAHAGERGDARAARRRREGRARRGADSARRSGASRVERRLRRAQPGSARGFPLHKGKPRQTDRHRRDRSGSRSLPLHA